MLASALTLPALVLLLIAAFTVSATNPEGQKFLDENSKKDGVITLPSGLQYKVNHLKTLDYANSTTWSNEMLRFCARALVYITQQ